MGETGRGHPFVMAERGEPALWRCKPQRAVRGPGHRQKGLVGLWNETDS